MFENKLVLVISTKLEISCLRVQGIWTKLEISCFKNSEDLNLTDKLIIYPLVYCELTGGLIGVKMIELKILLVIITMANTS